MRINLKLLLIVTSLLWRSQWNLLLCMMRPCRQVLTQQIVSVVRPLMQLTFPSNANMITEHIAWHVIGLHRGCHCRRSLLNNCPLLNLHLLVDCGLPRLHFIRVIFDIHGLCRRPPERYIVIILNGKSLHCTLLIVDDKMLAVVFCDFQ